MKMPFLSAAIIGFICALSACSGGSDSPRDKPFPPQILLDMSSIPATFPIPISGGGGTGNTNILFFFMGPASATYYLYQSSPSKLSSPYLLPVIKDDNGDTWIATTMYVTGVNRAFYYELEQVGDSSKTQLVMALLQEKTFTAGVPQDPPYVLSLTPASLPASGWTKVGPGESGPMQGCNNNVLVGNGGYNFY
jgi:hypothetical protein